MFQKMPFWEKVITNEIIQMGVFAIPLLALFLVRPPNTFEVFCGLFGVFLLSLGLHMGINEVLARRRRRRGEYDSRHDPDCDCE